MCFLVCVGGGVRVHVYVYVYVKKVSAMCEKCLSVCVFVCVCVSFLVLSIYSLVCPSKKMSIENLSR